METEFLQTRRTGILHEAVELTNNQWHMVRVGDLYKCLGTVLKDPTSLKPYQRLELASSQPLKELELIHLLELLRLFSSSELIPFTLKLQQKNPQEDNSIQPYWEPDYNNNQVALGVTLDNGSQLVLFTTGEYLEIPLEI